MITKETMFDPMLEACPSFRSSWEEFCDEAADEEPRPYYWALGDLAHHLIAQYKAGETDEFEAVFAIVERWHLEGEHYVKEAATIGLLEGLQNVSGNNDLDPNVFVPWLGPESKKWWAELEAFWERVSDAAVIIRTAQLDDLEALWPLYEQLDELHRQARPDLFHVPLGERRSRDFLQERIDDPNTVCLVAVMGEEIVGLCTTIVREIPASFVKPAWRYAEIDEIVVEASYRRQGVATQLFDASVAWARQQPNVHDVLLSVYELNDDARRFYESKGFKTLHRKMELRL